MPSNLFGAGNKSERSAQDVKADQDAARGADTRQQRAAAAAGRDRRSIGTNR
jgi:hypothetical protein